MNFSVILTMELAIFSLNCLTVSWKQKTKNCNQDNFTLIYTQTDYIELK